MKLLVVDDDIRIRKMLAAMLSDISNEVFECGDGQQAREIYAANLPDWVLMDLKMPLVDGITATKLIKSSHPEAKIIIVTTFESPAMRANASAAGAFAYILKDDLSSLRNILLGTLPKV